MNLKFELWGSNRKYSRNGFRIGLPGLATFFEPEPLVRVPPKPPRGVWAAAAPQPGFLLGAGVPQGEKQYHMIFGSGLSLGVLGFWAKLRPGARTSQRSNLL